MLGSVVSSPGDEGAPTLRLALDMMLFVLRLTPFWTIYSKPPGTWCGLTGICVSPMRTAVKRWWNECKEVSGTTKIKVCFERPVPKWQYWRTNHDYTLTNTDYTDGTRFISGFTDEPSVSTFLNSHYHPAACFVTD